MRLFCQLNMLHEHAYSNQYKGKTFREMKKDVGMTTAQKSKETRRMKMVCSVYPANNPYIYVG